MRSHFISSFNVCSQFRSMPFTFQVYWMIARQNSGVIRIFEQYEIVPMCHRLGSYLAGLADIQTGS
jgi:hypothetical protein